MLLNFQELKKLVEGDAAAIRGAAIVGRLCVG